MLTSLQVVFTPLLPPKLSGTLASGGKVVFNCSLSQINYLVDEIALVAATPLDRCGLHGMGKRSLLEALDQT